MKVYLQSNLGSVGTVTLLVSGLVIILIAMVGIFAPQLSDTDPMLQNLTARYTAPNEQYYMGTDELGRDIFIRVIYGSRASMGIAAAAALLSLFSGGLLGFISGFAGGRFDTLVVRLNDMLMALPAVLTAITIITFIGSGIFNLILALSISSFPRFLRMARSIAISIRNTEYVFASTSFGASTWWQIAKHVIPNGIPLMLVLVTSRMGTIILAESSLSFLGLGIPPGTPSWGAMISSGRTVLREAPWVSFAPGIAMILVILGYNQLGDSLRDLLDPRMRGAGIGR
jgi:peptide/nickel transport system permease protein